jgi:hypothetical protein
MNINLNSLKYFECRYSFPKSVTLSLFVIDGLYLKLSKHLSGIKRKAEGFGRLGAKGREQRVFRSRTLNFQLLSTS